MEIIFFKYQGTGNDFIMIDNRSLSFPKEDHSFIENLCNRRFGIGADGLILLENSASYDFKMVYYNADGKEGSMCGNGGRCIVAFAAQLGIIDGTTSFDAVDGAHSASISNGIVSLKMIDVSKVECFDSHLFLNTGSPHHIEFLSDLNELNVVEKGAKIRYGAPYFETGTNVNFATQYASDHFKVRTYERGVENETLACGTGVTAVAIAAHKSKRTTDCHLKLDVLGGALEVMFDVKDQHYSNIFLKGPAQKVFQGKLNI